MQPPLPEGPDERPHDVLSFPAPIMGTLYDTFDSVITDILRAEAPAQPPASASHRRPDPLGRGVRDVINPHEGRGYADYFKLSEGLCVSVADLRYIRNTWINIAAGSGLMKLRVLLSGRLLSHAGAVIAKTTEALLDISPGSSQTGYYVPANERTRIVCLHCRPRYLTDIMGLKPSDLPPPLRLLFTHEKTLERYKWLPDAKALQAARQIAESRAVAPALRAPYMEALSVQILIHHINALTPQRPTRPDAALLRARDLKKLVSARDHLVRHFVNPPKIAALARLVGLSQTQLKAGFRTLTGLSIYQYVLRCRMQRAADLLTQDYDVAQVAFKVGYAHPTNFTHAFKQYYGTLPSQLTTRHPA